MFLKGFLHAYIMVRLTTSAIRQSGWEADRDYRLALANKMLKDKLKRNRLKKMSKKQRTLYFIRQKELDKSFELALQKDTP